MKNVVFMAPDGMGLAAVTAARIYRNGIGGAPLRLETLPFIGYQRTHSRNSAVTDSAAGASAWASGDKFNNGEISCIDEDRNGACDGVRKHAETLLERAKRMGKSTGLVTTSDITHATPAAWAAHVHHRMCESEIFRQFLETGVDVMLGGGVALNRGDCKLAPTDGAHTKALIRQAAEMGYRLVETAAEMAASIDASDRMLGLFKAGGLTPRHRRSSTTTEPELKEMTEAALAVLENNEKGFFLVVEGAQIDWFSHAWDVKGQIVETLGFDDAVGAVMDWADARPDRKKETLIVVAADHETGGFSVNGPRGRLPVKGDTDTPYILDKGGNSLPALNSDGNIIYAPDLKAGWTTRGHTAVDTLIWSNASALARPMDNTDVYDIICNIME